MTLGTGEPTPRVLLAEDEAELASLYESWLDTAYDVTTVGDGDAAVTATTWCCSTG